MAPIADMQTTNLDSHSASTHTLHTEPSTNSVAAAPSVEMVSPLPTLRAPTVAAMDIDNVTPLPTLRTASTAAPAPFEPEDEGSFVLVDTLSDTQGPLGVPTLEDAEHIQNPVSLQDTQSTQSNSPFITLSTERSMVNQTLRSFETRTGTPHSTSSKSKTNSLPCTSSSSMVIFDNIAPSDLEIYDQAGLGPPVKVAEHRTHIDENMLHASTNLDLNTSDMSDPVPAAVLSDIQHIRALTMEGCTTLTSLTLAINSLVDLPRERTHTTREPRDTWDPAVQAVANAEAKKLEQVRANLKRDQPYAGFEAPDQAAKQQKSFSNYSDIYLYDVNTAADSPMSIARKALKRLGMSMNDVISV
ncbi:hypothetical protein B0H19DRAFT_1252151 [Mycena capillaripes]|nr:hypothetical protein B0H19DRAFT_1252151 [Mycena capillaripes]